MDMEINLPRGWECKIEPKTGRLYFINHKAKSTTWDDPRLSSIPPPPYHVAVTQPTTYFEDIGGSRWSSPVASLKAFSLQRRGSSPRLGGSPRIAPSPPKPIRKEHANLDSDQHISGAQPQSSSTSTATATTKAVVQKQLQSQRKTPPSNESFLHKYHDSYISSTGSPRPSSSGYNRASSTPSAASNKLFSSSVVGETTNDVPFQGSRPQSARSYDSYCPAITTLANCDKQSAIRFLSSLFPTAGEAHISNLFDKYHDRATLVYSALQVEKHPVVDDISQPLQLRELSPKQDGDSKSIGVSFTTGSPARTGTPISLLKYSDTKSSTSPAPIQSVSPRLQMVLEEEKLTKSTKMKLKYIKGIFPAADETFILDVLTSCDNNVHKTSEKLLRIGINPTPRPPRQQRLEVMSMMEKRQRAIDQERIALSLDPTGAESPFPTPVMKPARPHLSAREKEDLKKKLKGKFPKYPERFIDWALDSAMFDATKTEKLLQQVSPQTPDEFKPFIQPDTSKNDSEQRTQQRRIHFADGLGDLSSPPMSSSKGDNVDTPDSGYFELDIKTRKKNFISPTFGMKPESRAFVPTSQKAKGSNIALAKGPNPSFVKSSYIQTLGPSSVTKGPNPKLRQGPMGLAHGHTPSLAKGSVWGRKGHAARDQLNLQFVSVEG